MYALHRDLLRLRREDLAFREQARGSLEGAVLSASAFVLRFITTGHAGDRLLVVNLGPDLRRASFAEPLMAPPPDRDWGVIWSSEDPQYGGVGTPALWEDDGGWLIPAESALVLSPSLARQLAVRVTRRRTA